MSAFLQFTEFNCLIHDETAKKAIKSYVGILQEAFQKYQNLWENYIKLQEKYEQCNAHSSLQVMTDEPCTELKDELTPQRQLNKNSTIVQEESVSLLELDTLNEGSFNLSPNIGTDFSPYPSELLCKNTEDSESPPNSPVFSRKCLRTGGISVKKFARLPKAEPICNNLISDMNAHSSSKKVPLKCSQKLDISTSHHVETTFLPNGKRLKQSRLVFHPVKCNEKISLVQKHKADSIILPKVEQESVEDTSVAKFSIENGAIGTNETLEDIIEISPTQRNITKDSKTLLSSKITQRLKLKRKNNANQAIKSKCHDPVSKIPPTIMIDDMDFTLCSSPEHTFTEAKDDKLSGNNINTIFNTTSKDKVNNLLPVKMYSENVEVKKEDESVTNKVPNIAGQNDAFAESFYLSAELVVNKDDFIDDFNLDDTENKPPKKASLARLRKRKENDQINMRSKTDRAKLNGWDCWECEKYYKNLPLSKEEIQKRKNQCSRHRSEYERPYTPEGFWDPEFPETLSSTYRQ